jgi:FKBP-type peptidyl-prolyl cis-trans isomerase
VSVKTVLKRTGWASLALLFVATGLGVGIYGFWQYTHPPKEDKPETSSTQSTDTSNKDSTTTDQTSTKLEGTMLEGFTPVAKVDKLQAIDKKVGTGTEVKSNSEVTAHYTGALASSGVIFQSSLDSGKPFTTTLDQVIKGWQQGMPGMKAGGERRLIIPAALAYGDNPPSGIPVNADLVFDIVLVSVK